MSLTHSFAHGLAIGSFGVIYDKGSYLVENKFQ